ncbi:hypothetical protein SLEP1_g60468, partial [Rubroshorea leprosula]
ATSQKKETEYLLGKVNLFRTGYHNVMYCVNQSATQPVGFKIDMKDDKRYSLQLIVGNASNTNISSVFSCFVSVNLRGDIRIPGRRSVYKIFRDYSEEEPKKKRLIGLSEDMENMQIGDEEDDFEV